jgi:hypothetical protein
MEAISNLTVYTNSVTAAEEGSVNEQLKLKQTTSPYEYSHFMALSMEKTKELENALEPGAKSETNWNSWKGLTNSQINDLLAINPTLGEYFVSYSKATFETTKETYESVKGYRVWKESD